MGTIAGAPSQTAITCPACGASTGFYIGWVRSCGGTFCQHCTELILLDGEFIAASCEAIDNAMRELDAEISELRKPAGENVVRLRLPPPPRGAPRAGIIHRCRVDSIF